MKARGAHLFLCLLFGALISSRAADQFGDVSVDASAIYTGNTYHGYAEMRVMLENHSREKSHLVTLIYPNDTFGGMGNSIGRLSRSMTLAPGAREVVSLLQPPLPSQGDSSIRIEVDKKHEGEVHAPNANNHCNYNYRGGGRSATVFISRSLDFDAVQRVFQATRGAFTAAMAVGAPDASGVIQNTWMPNVRRRGEATWLQLEYATPQAVDTVVIHQGYSGGASGTIELTGVSGTNIATIPMPGHGRGGVATCSCSLTREPVKTVTLNFTSTGPISIDAVQISGPSGAQWASDASASSDNSATAGMYGGRSADTVESLRAESPVAEWSGTWLAYSPFDCVVVGALDLISMPPAVQGALGDYLAAGGTVVVSGRANLPEAWHPLQKESIDAGEKFRVGFGSCFVLTSGDFSKLGPDTVRAVREEARSNGRYWQSLPENSGAANNILPVVASLNIPTRGIVIIMIAFIVAIGPVNIIVLNRLKRRTWMLWTIPAISMVTMLIVFIYSLAREGITPDARIAGLTVIDQAGHHAATIGGTAFYCPLTPSAGLHFEFNTEATPLVEVSYNSGTSREVDWTQFQQFRRGWLSSRVPAYFHLRKSETRRERIQIILEGGSWQIVNGLGAPIKALWIVAPDRNVYRAENVAAGDKAGLTILKKAAPTEKLGVDELLRKLGFGAQPESLKDCAFESLLPNTYVAVLDGNPFIENALGSAASPKRTKSSSVVLGFLETPATP